VGRFVGNWVGALVGAEVGGLVAQITSTDVSWVDLKCPAGYTK
jgi:hypothetical protein